MISPAQRDARRRRHARWALAVWLIGQLPAPLAFAESLPVPCGGGACGGAADQFVSSGTASITTAPNALIVQQDSERAVLNWRSFDVGAQDSVRFRQPSDAAVALNRIHDSNPSTILGRVDANGQVYLVNTNGIVFGEGARVDVGGLVAASLDVPDSVFDGPGIAGAISQGNGAPALVARVGSSPGAVTVARGAQLRAVAGGRVLLAGSEVTNAGEIRADEGQVLLVAARDRVFLQPSSNSDLRGFLVGVGTGGSVLNSGDILVSRGNATLLGAAVNQTGRVSATTSVRLNGTIRLLAQDGATVQVTNGVSAVQSARTGTVTIGANSSTTILPQLDDVSLVVDDQPQPVSRIDIVGAQLSVGSGAGLRAPSGTISLFATDVPNSSRELPAGSRAANRISIADGAAIDVAGIDSTVLAQSRNLVTVDLRANELADAPLQRNGVLRGDSVVVDARFGTPIAAVDATIATVQRGVGERLAIGGTIELISAGDVVVGLGARLDVRGGAVTFEPGVLATTRLATGGRVIDIADATPDLFVDAIVRPYTRRHSRWGVTETFDGFVADPVGSWVPGYVEGKDAGALLLRARGGAFAGELLAAATAGIYQRRQPGSVRGLARPFDELPLRGSLTIDLRFDRSTTAVARDVAIVLDAPALGADAILDLDHRLLLGESMLEASALGRLEIGTFGRFELRDDVRLDVAGGTAIVVESADVLWAGALHAAGGDLRIVTGRLDNSAANLRFASTAVVDVRGAWVNDLLGADEAPAALWIDGGNVELIAGGDLDVTRGSRILVGGGAWLDANGELLAGRGGDLGLTSRLIDRDTLLLIGGAFVGTSVGRGGTLRIEANQIAIAPGPPGPGGGSTTQPAPGPNNFLILPAAGGFDLGFGRYEFASNRYDLLIGDTTLIAPPDRRLVLGDDYARVVSGTPLDAFATVGTLADHERGPIDVSLEVVHSARSDVRAASALRMPAGARINLAPGAALSLVTDQRLLVDGELIAPGGTIQLGIEPGESSYRLDQAIWLGATARLDARATFVDLPDDNGVNRARGIDGGRVELRAERGFVVMAPGARIDVSGASRVLDVRRTDGSVAIERDVLLSAGEIDVLAAEGFSLQGELIGRAARADAAAGRLSVTVDANVRDAAGDPRFPTTQFQPRVQIGERFAALTSSAGDAVDARLAGTGELGVGVVRNGGIGSLAVSVRDLLSTQIADEFDALGRIEFVDDTALSLSGQLRLDSGRLLFSADADVSLEATYAVLGNIHVGGSRGIAQAGTGSLSVAAQGIDLFGVQRIDGARSVALSAKDDVRLIGVQPRAASRELRGEFVSAGEIDIEARQVLATTLVDFRMAADRILLRGNDSLAPPALAAGGRVALSASTIRIDGTLAAPGGSVELRGSSAIALGERGVVDVSLRNTVVPFGRTQGGLDWVYPLDRSNALARIITAPPTKQVQLDAPRIELAEGSTIDLRGGGDLEAIEFVRGPGGSRDVTDPQFSAGAFAVLPGVQTLVAPYDRLELDGFAFRYGDAVELSAHPDLAAGVYTILPTRYALLPGARLVTPVVLPDGTELAGPRQRDDGVTVVPGRLVELAGGSGATQRVGSGVFGAFAVEPGSAVTLRSEFSRTGANSFFAAAAARLDRAVPLLPRDGGAITLLAQNELRLDGDVLAAGGAAAGALAGSADIAARSLVVVKDGSPVPSGFVGLLESQLQSLQVGSLTLGARRSLTTDGDLQLVGAAERVRLDDGVELRFTELLVFASDTVDVGENVRIGPAVGQTSATRITRDILLPSRGALLGVSGTADLTTTRTAGGLPSGELAVGAGSVLDAPSVLLVAPTRLTLDGGFADALGSLSQRDALRLSTSRVTLGEGLVGDGSATVLDAATLRASGIRELAIEAGEEFRVEGAFTLPLEQFALTAARLVGAIGADQRVEIDARDIDLAGVVATAPAAPSESGTGVLALTAERLQLRGGELAVNGLAGLSLTARERLTTSDSGALTTRADATIDVPQVVLGAGSRYSIDTGDSALTLRGGTGAVDSTLPLGGSLSLRGGDIRLGTTVLGAVGQINVSAQGTLAVEDAARLVAGGRTVALGPVVRQLPAGRITLRAQQDLSLASGALLDVGSDVGGGRLTLTAGGNLMGSGMLRGAGAELVVDGGSIAEPTSLDAAAARGGFEQLRSYRQRNGDLRFASTSPGSLSSLTLTADGGSVRVTAPVTLGDTLTVFGQDGIDLAAPIRFTSDARARVALHLGAATASLALPSGNLIAPAGLDLQLTYSSTTSPASLAAGVGALPQDSRLVLAPRQTLSIDDGRLDSVDIALAEAAFQALAMSSGDRQTWLASSGLDDSALLVRPTLEVLAAGDLTVVAPWQLRELRVDDQPGSLIVRAAGDLRVDADLDDGFVLAANELFGIDVERLAQSESFAVGLVAGADLTALDPLAVFSGRGDLRLGAGVRVRTGTGDIDLVAGRDLVFGDARSTVYSAGRSTGPGNLPREFVEQALPSGLFPEFAADGGDVRVVVGRDLLGMRSNQRVSEWMVRFGGPVADAPPSVRPVIVGVVAEAFRQGIGAFGDGARMTIDVGRDARDLELALPRTLQHVGDADHFSTDPLLIRFSDGAVFARGADSLQVRTGRDLLGGFVYQGMGEARLRAAGAIVPTAVTRSGLVLATNNAQFDVLATGDLRLETTYDTTIAPLDENGLQTSIDNSFFFSYSADSRLRVASLTGSTTLGNDRTRAFSGRGATPFDFGADVYPGTVEALAYSGDVVLERGFTLFPVATGGLTIAAARNVRAAAIASNSLVDVIVSDADPALLPNIDAPRSDTFDAAARLPRTGIGPANVLHAQSPVHAADSTPSRIVAVAGDIDANRLRIYAAEAVEISAARDITIGQINVQHANTSDVTRIVAGRDFRFPTGRDEATGRVLNSVDGIDLAGPGRLELIAGRDIDLGTSDGVVTTGNTTNPVLPDGGARIDLFAGVDVLGVERFTALYVAGDALRTTATTRAVRDFMRARTGDASLGDDASRLLFLGLPAEQQRPLVVELFFSELIESGKANALDDTVGFERGFAAIDTLFPEDMNRSGRIDLFFSRIGTVDGGDINLLAPRGGVNVGLSASFAGAKPVSELGIVAQRNGAVRAFVDDDFQINQSRVFALDGGDIVIWSSAGDIDAGRGAKSALSAPPPTLSFDSNGNVVVEFPPAISGSGIRGAVATPGRSPGTIFLFAPAGAVIASDAPIVSAGDVFIAATQVVGTDISAGGVTVGVPVGTDGLAASLGSVADVGAQASREAAAAASNDSATRAAPVGRAAIGFLEVYLEGFDDERPAARRRRSG